MSESHKRAVHISAAVCADRLADEDACVDIGRQASRRLRDNCHAGGLFDGLMTALRLVVDM
jgi:hypothetical protein